MPDAMEKPVLRRVTPADRADYLTLAREFYDSGATLFVACAENLTRTFDELMRSDTYAEAYLIDWQGARAGFVLLAKTYSQEAGGMVLWIEELYLRPRYRGYGIGSFVFDFLRETYGETFVRIRLEIEAENEGARRLYRRQGFTDYPYEQMKLEL